MSTLATLTRVWLVNVQVDDDYFPIVESAMDDSREALQRFCQLDAAADPRMPPMNLNDSVRIDSWQCCGPCTLYCVTLCPAKSMVFSVYSSFFLLCSS